MRCCVDLGRERLPAETISGYIGHGAPVLVARALGAAASEEERGRALQFFLAHYEEHKLDNTCAYPGVAKGWRNWRGAECRWRC